MVELFPLDDQTNIPAIAVATKAKSQIENTSTDVVSMFSSPPLVQSLPPMPQGMPPVVMLISQYT